MARLRNAVATQPAAFSAADTLVTRRALKEKTNTTPASTRTTATRQGKKKTDAQPRELVKDMSVARTRGRQSAAAMDQEPYMMAGALGPEDPEPVTSEDPPAQMTDTVEKDNEETRPVARKGPQRRGMRNARKVVQSHADKQAMEDVRRRMEAAKSGRIVDSLAAQPVAQSALSSEDVLVRKSPEIESRHEHVAPATARPAKRTSMLHQPPGSALRLQNTPALESSLLALKNFKRRPRQGSMLQMVQQRTASARPSIAQITDLNDSTMSGLDLDLGLSSSDEEADDFMPDAEGTPLHAAKANRTLSIAADRIAGRNASAQSSSPQAKRKSDVLDASVGATASDRLRKRRSGGSPAEATASLDEPLAQHGVVPSSIPVAPMVVRDESEILVVNSAAPTPASTQQIAPARQSTRLSQSAEQDNEIVIPSTEEAARGQPTPARRSTRSRHTMTEDLPAHEMNPDDTLAEPASSSPPVRIDSSQADYLAEPLTQHSSPPPAAKTCSRLKPDKPIMTATLQALLPKRRRNLARSRPAGRTEYDLGASSDHEDVEISFDASHLDEDEDELGGRIVRQRVAKPARAARKSKQTPTKKTQNRTLAASTAKRNAAGNHATTTPQRTRNTAAGAAGATTTSTANKRQQLGSVARTYASRRTRRDHASDKENAAEDDSAFEDGNDVDDTNDISLTMHEIATGPELQAAKQKFAEVDQWDMEFESMSMEDHRSSSFGWR